VSRAQLRGLVGYAALFALLLFAGAGTLDWPAAWILLAVLVAVQAWGNVRIYRVSPELVRERAKGPLQRGGGSCWARYRRRCARSVSLASRGAGSSFTARSRRTRSRRS
jgi:hypothetical protein